MRLFPPGGAGLCMPNPARQYPGGKAQDMRGFKQGRAPLGAVNGVSLWPDWGDSTPLEPEEIPDQPDSGVLTFFRVKLAG